MNAVLIADIVKGSKSYTGREFRGLNAVYDRFTAKFEYIL